MNAKQKAKIERKITALKLDLARTDYQAIKYAEGEITDAEYATIRAERRAWREEINTLEAKLSVLRS